MWVLKKSNDRLFVAKPEITQITGSSYTTSLRHAKKFSSRDEAVTDSCVENEIPVQLDPYEYFK